MTDNLRGILAILASATAFVVNDALIKLATEELGNVPADVEIGRRRCSP